MTSSEIQIVEKFIIDFNSPVNEYSSYKNLPISCLPLVRSYLKSKNIKFRVRYRGQRNNPLDTRHYHNRASDCLAKFANKFTVYINF